MIEEIGEVRPPDHEDKLTDYLAQIACLERDCACPQVSRHISFENCPILDSNPCGVSILPNPNDTFGDEAFWGDTLKLHQAIAGAKHGGVGPGVSPKTALAVGLKVDMMRSPTTSLNK